MGRTAREKPTHRKKKAAIFHKKLILTIHFTPTNVLIQFEFGSHVSSLRYTRRFLHTSACTSARAQGPLLMEHCRGNRLDILRSGTPEKGSHTH